MAESESQAAGTSARNKNVLRAVIIGIVVFSAVVAIVIVVSVYAYPAKIKPSQTGAMSPSSINKAAFSGKRWTTPNAYCAIPFEYRGKKHTTCITDDRKNLWCSLTAKYEGRWDYCVNQVLPNSRCIFPFTYKGKTYVGCGRTSWMRHWCYQPNGKWHYCIIRSITPHEDCHFPFNYKDDEYTNCTAVGVDFGFWCATKNYKSDGQWRYCYDTSVKASNECRIPFIYKGVTYRHCLVDSNGYWCSKTRTYNGRYADCTLKPGTYARKQQLETLEAGDDLEMMFDS